MAVERVFRIYWGPTLENALDFAWPVAGTSPVAWRAPRDGSEQVLNGASTIGWITGRHYRYKVTAQYFALPQFAGGVGLQAFMDWASDSNAFTVVPNLNAPGLTVPGCYLEGPFTQTKVALEGDASQTLDLTFLHPTVDLGLAFRGLFFEYAAGGSLTDPVDYAFARASGSYELNWQGYLHQNASGVIGDGHYPTPFVSGLQTTLFHNAVTNDLFAPVDLTNAIWTKTDVTIAADASTAPDQTLTGDLIVEALDGAPTFHSVVNNTNWSVTAGDVVTAVAFVKSGGRFKGRVYISDTTATDRCGIEYDLHAGTVASATGGAGVLLGSFITPMANGWSMLWWRGTVNGTSTSLKAVLTMEDATGATSYTGDGASGTYFWGMTAVHGSQHTVATYVPSGSPTASDALSAPFAVPPQGMWFYVKGVNVMPQVNFTTLVAIGSFTAPNWRFTLNQSATILAMGSGNTSGARNASVAGLGLAQFGAVFEVFGSVDANGVCNIRLSINGGPETAGGATTALALPASFGVPTIWIANDSGNSPMAQALSVVRVGPYVPTGIGAVTTIAQARMT
jgi:hypothetical protein